MFIVKHFDRDKAIAIGRLVWFRMFIVKHSCISPLCLQPFNHFRMQYNLASI